MEELLEQAKLTLKNSYSPYSNFRVGAAIRTNNGQIFTGTNIENSSYGLTICAERVALFKAVSSGHTSFTDLAIISSSNEATFPCGACRQVLFEFSPEIRIHFEGRENEFFYLADLLPHGFNLKKSEKKEKLVKH